jgi:hypothetical protein
MELSVQFHFCLFIYYYYYYYFAVGASPTFLSIKKDHGSVIM